LPTGLAADPAFHEKAVTASEAWREAVQTVLDRRVAALLAMTAFFSEFDTGLAAGRLRALRVFVVKTLRERSGSPPSE
jgi:hypothetical protein